AAPPARGVFAAGAFSLGLALSLDIGYGDYSAFPAHPLLELLRHAPVYLPALAELAAGGALGLRRQSFVGGGPKAFRPRVAEGLAGLRDAVQGAPEQGGWTAADTPDGASLREIAAAFDVSEPTASEQQPETWPDWFPVAPETFATDMLSAVLAAGMPALP